ncbi:MAG TPA: DNA ligase [Gammaproteobacteria bacterium]|nr:DNA ligase [Gammaproteobacteria bacterium]
MEARRLLALLSVAALFYIPDVVFGEKPALMLATRYHQDIDVGDYWVSEKLDGVRARWDGSHLVSRGGYHFAAPSWFTEEFPTEPLDGELWIGRGQYEKVSAVVRKMTPHDGWKQVRLMVFDLPQHKGRFTRRLESMRQLVEQAGFPYLAVIRQYRVADNGGLMQRLQSVIDGGGEGLMLHRATALYRHGRSDDLLKLKQFSDAEATVIGYRPGKGMFSGVTGSLKVQNDDGIVFYVGSGLSLDQRADPPPISSRITYRYQGFTKNGVPRFAVFLRVRNETPLQ